MPKREHPVGCGVSLHVAQALGHAHPAPPTPMSRGNGVKGHTRSGADDESRTRGLGHGVAVLYQLSYIRKRCKTNHRPVPRFVLRQLVKEHPPLPVVRSFDRWPAPMRRPVRVGKQKRPGSLRNPGLCEQRFEGARLRAALSRMHLVLVPIKPLMACRDAQMHCAVATAERLHRGSTLERDQTLHGSVGSDDVAGFHDEVPRKIDAR